MAELSQEATLTALASLVVGLGVTFLDFYLENDKVSWLRWLFRLTAYSFLSYLVLGAARCLFQADVLSLEVVGQVVIEAVLLAAAAFFLIFDDRPAKSRYLQTAFIFGVAFAALLSAKC